MQIRTETPLFYRTCLKLINKTEFLILKLVLLKSFFFFLNLLRITTTIHNASTKTASGQRNSLNFQRSYINMFYYFLWHFLKQYFLFFYVCIYLCYEDNLSEVQYRRK